MTERVLQKIMRARWGGALLALVGAVMMALAGYLSAPAVLAQTNGGQTGVLTSQSVAQGTAAAPSAAWPMKVTDGTSVVGTGPSAGFGLNVAAAGADQSNSAAYLRVDAWGDGVSTSLKGLLGDSYLSAYNGSSYDRLRTSTADGSSKTGVLETTRGYTVSANNAAGTFTVKASGGILHSITINTPAAGTLKIYNVAGAGCSGTPANLVATVTLTASTNPETLTYDGILSNGICIVSSASIDFWAMSE